MIRWCKINTRMNIAPENSTFAQTELVHHLSTLLKKNLVSIRKHFRRRASSAQEEPRRLFSSLSKHVTYILNIHHPLHSKIQVLFRRYRAKNKKTLNEEELTWRALEEAALEDSADHGIGSNMTEQGYIRRRSSNVYVPILLPETDCPQNHPGRYHRNLGRETGGCNRKCQTRNTSAPKT